MNLKALAMIGALVCIWAGAPYSAQARRGFTERDKMTDEEIKTEGFLPVLQSSYTISAIDPKWDERVSYVMSQNSALLVEITPVKKPAGVLMFASTPGLRRALKAVWANDHMTEPVRFWTNRFWTSDKVCDDADCPRITFKATKGTVEVNIIDKRP